MGFRVKRSAALFKCSWQVLKTDKTLALFPVISAVATLLMAAAFLTPILSVPSLRSDAIEFVHDMEEDHRALESEQSPGYERGAPDAQAAFDDGNAASGETAAPAPAPAPKLSAMDIGFLIYGFAFFFCCSFVVIFFNAALVGATNRKFEGEPTGVMVGLGIACQRLPQILAWALVNAIVGTILRALEERMGAVGRIVILVIGVAWSIATYFAIPTLVIEGVGPFKAVRNSVSAIKRTWGESLVIAIGFGCIGSIVTLLGVSTLIAGAAIGVLFLSQERTAEAIALGGTLASVGIVILILWSVLSSTLMAITRTALYRYAVDGVVPGGFDESALASAFVDRTRSEPAH